MREERSLKTRSVAQRFSLKVFPRVLSSIQGFSSGTLEVKPLMSVQQKFLRSGSFIENRITQYGAFSVFHDFDPSGRSTTA